MVGIDGFMVGEDKHSLILVEAATKVHEGEVTVSTPCKVAGSPPFDTNVVPQFRHSAR